MKLMHIYLSSYLSGLLPQRFHPYSSYCTFIEMRNALEIFLCGNVHPWTSTRHRFYNETCRTMLLIVICVIFIYPYSHFFIILMRRIIVNSIRNNLYLSDGIPLEDQSKVYLNLPGSFWLSTPYSVTL